MVLFYSISDGEDDEDSGWSNGNEDSSTDTNNDE